LSSLSELLNYRPELSVPYLPFWYFAWNQELLALIRSGPRTSFMVVTNSVEQFLRFASDFRGVSDYFVMCTSTAPSVNVGRGVLPIPPTWKFPRRFPFLMMKRKDPSENGGEHDESTENRERTEDGPQFRMIGPARNTPPYMMVETGSEVKGEEHFIPLVTPSLPQEAIDLMLRTPAEDLTSKRAFWLPSERFEAKDPFLGDLLTGRARGLFPVYLDHIPGSDAAVRYAAVQISVPRGVLDAERSPGAVQLKMALLRLTTLQGDDARTALLDLPAAVGVPDLEPGASVDLEVHLFEFTYAGGRRLHPVLLVAAPYEKGSPQGAGFPRHDATALATGSTYQTFRIIRHLGRTAPGGLKRLSAYSPA